MARKKVHGKPLWLKKQALEQIEHLFKEAKKQFKHERELANAYIATARKLSLKYKVSLPRELKRQMCKHCFTFLVPGVNLRIRTNKGKVVYYCLECKKFMRFTYPL